MSAPKAVETIHQASLWPTAAAAYAAAREFHNARPADADDCQVRPVPVVGRFALQLETARGVKPARVLGYLVHVLDDPASEMRESPRP